MLRTGLVRSSQVRRKDQADRMRLNVRIIHLQRLRKKVTALGNHLTFARPFLIFRASVTQRNRDNSFSWLEWLHDLHPQPLGTGPGALLRARVPRPAVNLVKSPGSDNTSSGELWGPGALARSSVS